MKQKKNQTGHMKLVDSIKNIRRIREDRGSLLILMKLSDELKSTEEAH